MSSIPRLMPDREMQPAGTGPVDHSAFLRLLPAVETRAAIEFRHLPAFEREEAIAEAVAGALVNYRIAERHGKANTVTPGTLARFAVLHVRNGRHVGSSCDGKRDVMSRTAQRRYGFRVHTLPDARVHGYDCMKDPTLPVWKAVLMDDRRTPVPDQVSFRRDWSSFLAKQSDRTRTALAMLGAGFKQNEVAERLNVTAPAICQRIKKARREWISFQGETDRCPGPCSGRQCQYLV